MLVFSTNNAKTDLLKFQESGDEGFEKAYQQCVKACDAFLKEAVAGNV